MTVQQTKDLEATILQEVDGDEAWNTVEALATTVRLSGNEDEAKAIAYLQSKLDAYGVKQTLYTPTLFVSWPLKATLRVLGAPPVRPRMLAGTSSTRNPALHAWTSASTESMYSTG